MQYIHGHLWCITKDVSIPQAVWIACNIKGCTLLLLRCRCFNTASGMDCMQLKMVQTIILSMYCFNTASGMDCMQFTNKYQQDTLSSFNTASGMDCMQSSRGLRHVTLSLVSIPQAVWIACNGNRRATAWHCCRFNTASGMDCMQYCLPEALETVSPKTEFLTMTPFSRFFPK